MRSLGEEEFAIAPPPVLKSKADGGGKRILCTSESFQGQKQFRNYGSAFRAWAPAPLSPTTAAPKVDSVFDSGPRSRGFPYSYAK